MNKPIFKAIIGFGGKQRAGKSYAAHEVQAILGDSTPSLQTGFADALKEMARELGWDGEKDEKGRRFLQELGTACRNYDPDFWVKRLQSRAKAAWVFNPTYPLGGLLSDVVLIIPDMRFENETRWARQAASHSALIYVNAFEGVRAERGLLVGGEHVSEQADPRWFDVTVQNNNEPLEFIHEVCGAVGHLVPALAVSLKEGLTR